MDARFFISYFLKYINLLQLTGKKNKMVSDTTIDVLGYVTFAIVALLLLSYTMQKSKLGGELFFTKSGNKELMKHFLCFKKRSLIGIGALIAFVINLVFVGSVAFNDDNWDSSKQTYLMITLVLQLVYYILQLGYIPILWMNLSHGLFYNQLLLGVCAACQIASFVLAYLHAEGYSKWLNLPVALWTFGFDFWIHSFMPIFAKTFLINYRMSLFEEKDTGESTQTLLL